MIDMFTNTVFSELLFSEPLVVNTQFEILRRLGYL